MPKKLRAELPGILAWAVHGCLEWQREGLGEPDEVRAATDQYRDESDALSGFIDECCVVRPDAWCKFKPLYAAYADKLTERGFAAGNGSGNVAIRRGIALRHDGDPGPSRVNDHGPKTEEPHDLPPEGGKTANPGVNELTVDNSQIACKSGSSVNGVNNSYPESGMNEADTYKSGYVERPLTDVNSLTLKDRKSTQHEGGGEIATPRGDDHRRLTADEAERVQRLIHEGMSPRHARAEILGEE